MIRDRFAEISKAGYDSLDATTHSEELASESSDSAGLVFGIPRGSSSHDLACNAIVAMAIVRIEGIRGVYQCGRLILLRGSGWLLFNVLFLLFSLFEHLVEGVFKGRAFGGIVSCYFNVLTLISVASFLPSS